MDIVMHPIGVIRTPFTEPSEAPIQASRSRAAGRVEVDPAFSPGLQDLEGFSHIYLLYVFHRSTGYALQVKPLLDARPHGLFATRYPARPNQVGLSVVRLMARQGDTLEVEGVDMLDGTPLLDIKPYVPEFDVHAVTHTGWYAQRTEK